MPRSSSQSVSLEDLHQMMGDRRYWDSSHPASQAWRAQVSEGFRAHFPGDVAHDATGRQTDDGGHGGTVHVNAYDRTVNGKEVHVSEHERGWPTSSGHSQTESRSRADEAPKAPPGVDVNKNIKEAEKHWAYTGVGDLWFKNQVQNHGPWDYKRQSNEYENFGNFNYGATGAAMGYSLDTLQRMAGWYQKTYGISDPSWGTAPSEFESYLGIGGRAPFGDDPKDQKQIQNGYEYYDKHHRKNR
jgi:hypothetical protein